MTSSENACNNKVWITPQHNKVFAMSLHSTTNRLSKVLVMTNKQTDSGRASHISSSVIETIGNTPLVCLSRLTKGLEGNIYAKLDMLNPGFSKKDRAALQIIEEAEQNGILQPTQPVVELTSGNMGTGLAIVCAIKGYSFIAVMSKGNSEERARMMRALGAEVILVDQLPGSIPGQVSGADLELVAQKADELTIELNAFRADQFERDGNTNSHFLHTGPEIWQQIEGNVDAFCDFVGSGGTLAGVSKYLKSKNNEIKCYAVEPEGAAALQKKEITNPDHPIQGGGYSMSDLTFLKDVELDGYVEVSSSEAKEYTRRLAKEEGIFAGFSSGTNVAAAMKLLQGPLKGKNIVVLVCDSGLKYLSTDLWD